MVEKSGKQDIINWDNKKKINNLNKHKWTKPSNSRQDFQKIFFKCKKHAGMPTD